QSPDRGPLPQPVGRPSSCRTSGKNQSRSAGGPLSVHVIHKRSSKLGGSIPAHVDAEQLNESSLAQQSLFAQKIQAQDFFGIAFTRVLLKPVPDSAPIAVGPGLDRHPVRRAIEIPPVAVRPLQVERRFAGELRKRNSARNQKRIVVGMPAWLGGAVLQVSKFAGFTGLVERQQPDLRTRIPDA